MFNRKNWHFLKYMTDQLFGYKYLKLFNYDLLSIFSNVIVWVDNFSNQSINCFQIIKQLIFKKSSITSIYFVYVYNYNRY